MRPAGFPGGWLPASAADRRLLVRVIRPRDGDPHRHPARDQVGYLVALCASRGVALTFDPRPLPAVMTAPPSPAPAAGQGARRNGRHHP